MFESLSQRLNAALNKLTGRGAIREEDVDAAMREVRVALLEADVALPTVKKVVADIKEKAVGQEVLRSVSAAQMVIKIVQDHLRDLLGGETAELSLNARPPVVILMVGLQGSGKTTSSAKLALRLKEKMNRQPLLASLDVQRPAAQEQLEVLAGQAGIASLPIIKGQSPLDIAKRALQAAPLKGADVVILDTAGRLHIDDQLMTELKQVRDFAQPAETLLVADALTGQDAVTIAREFHNAVGVSGIILTRMDGDARGGAALSMKTETGCPIKFVGVGEKLQEFEPFHPERVAARILDMGDVVSLVEHASEVIKEEEALAMAEKLKAGSFDFNDLLGQLRNMKKMGGMGKLMGMLPGIGKMKDQLKNANLDDSILNRQEAIILSMTQKERENPRLINGSRKRRIAIGCGMEVQDINRLLKQQRQMEDMMKKVKKMGKKGLMRGGLEQMLPPGMPKY